MASRRGTRAFLSLVFPRDGVFTSRSYNLASSSPTGDGGCVSEETPIGLRNWQKRKEERRRKKKVTAFVHWRSERR